MFTPSPGLPPPPPLLQVAGHPGAAAPMSGKRDLTGGVWLGPKILGKVSRDLERSEWNWGRAPAVFGVVDHITLACIFGT